ncbi:MAG: hypothetical protein LBL33_07060, partial [Tannerella sp.]|nr:hypothetical protein [Tannerella sp.]
DCLCFASDGRVMSGPGCSLPWEQAIPLPGNRLFPYLGTGCSLTWEQAVPRPRNRLFPARGTGCSQIT